MILGGCQAAFQGYPQRPSSLSDDLAALKDSVSAGKVKQCLGIVDTPKGEQGQASVSAPIPLTPARGSVSAPASRAPTPGDEGGLDERQCRDQLVAARMYAIDLRFSEFEESLFRQTRESGFAATLATLGLTTSAAFVGGGASQVLSGIAAFIIGGREAFQKEVLAERTLVAIHTAMRANRARVGVRLREGLQRPIICLPADGADCVAYPLASALSDLNDYYDAGTVLGALVGITEAVGTEARDQSRRLDNVTRGLDPDTGQEPTSGDTVLPPGPEVGRPTIQGAETEAELALVASQLESIQRYLCATKIDAIFGPETRRLIEIWQAAEGFTPPNGRIRPGREADKLVGNALLGTRCDLSVFRNYYERINLDTVDSVKALRASLAALDEALVPELPAEITSVDQLKDMRGAIDRAGVALGVDTSGG